MAESKLIQALKETIWFNSGYGKRLCWWAAKDEKIPMAFAEGDVVRVGQSGAFYRIKTALPCDRTEDGLCSGYYKVYVYDPERQVTMGGGSERIHVIEKEGQIQKATTPYALNFKPDKWQVVIQAGASADLEMLSGDVEEDE